MKQKVSGFQWYKQIIEMLSKFNCVVTTPDANREIVEQIVKYSKKMLCAFIRVNTEYKKYGFYISRGKNGNSIILPLSVVDEFCEKYGYDIDSLIETRQIIKYTSKEFIDIRHIKNVRRKQFSEYAKVRKNQRNYDILNSSTASEEQKRKAVLDIWSDKKLDNDEVVITKYESYLYNKLYKLYKKRIKKQQKFIINNRVYFVDIYMKAYKVAIEVDGGYHSTPMQIEKDKQKDFDLSTVGLLIIRIKNEDIERKYKLLTTILDKRHKDIVSGIMVSKGTMTL